METFHFIGDRVALKRMARHPPQLPAVSGRSKLGMIHEVVPRWDRRCTGKQNQY